MVFGKRMTRLVPVKIHLARNKGDMSVIHEVKWFMFMPIQAERNIFWIACSENKCFLWCTVVQFRILGWVKLHLIGFTNCSAIDQYRDGWRVTPLLASLFLPTGSPHWSHYLRTLAISHLTSAAITYEPPQPQVARSNPSRPTRWPAWVRNGQEGEEEG